MKTIKLKDKDELVRLYDGKIYGIQDCFGNVLFDAMEEDFLQMCDKGIIDEETYCFIEDIDQQSIENYKSIYGVKFIFTRQEYDDKNFHRLQELIYEIEKYMKIHFYSLNRRMSKEDFSKLYDTLTEIYDKYNQV